MPFAIIAAHVRHWIATAAGVLAAVVMAGAVFTEVARALACATSAFRASFFTCRDIQI
jgi:hypothetical protein